MTSSYEIIYSKFLGKIRDYSFAKLDMNVAYEQMNEWLHAVYGNPFARKLFKELSWDDEVMQIKYELISSIDEDYDDDFVCEMFARGMVIEWLEPKVKTTTLTAQMFSGKEQKFYSQSTMLTALTSSLEKEKADWRRFIRDYKYAEFAIKGVPNES